MNIHPSKSLFVSLNLICIFQTISCHSSCICNSDGTGMFRVASPFLPGFLSCQSRQKRGAREIKTEMSWIYIWTPRLILSLFINCFNKLCKYQFRENLSKPIVSSKKMTKKIISKTPFLYSVLGQHPHSATTCSCLLKCG